MDLAKALAVPLADKTKCCVFMMRSSSKSLMFTSIYKNLSHLTMASEKKLPENECEDISVSECAALQRVTAALAFYQSIKSDSKNETQIGSFLREYFSTYSNFLNDYGHVLHQHLHTGSVKQNNAQFEEIYDYISKQIQCDITTCPQFVRNNRNRQKTQNDSFGSQNTDIKTIFYLDLLDTIHCYLLHAFDVGFRIKTNELQINDYQLANDEELVDSDDSNADKSLLYKDNGMEKLKSFLGNRRKRLDEIAGAQRLQNNKFMTTVIDNTTLHNSSTDDHTNDDHKGNTDQEEDENDSTAATYSFGKRMYYWQRYKDHEWYVERKYDNLKQEILNNTICRLNVQEYELASQKAMLFMSSDYCKQCVSCYTNHLLYYDIRGGMAIDTDHLLSIILYTDYSKLCYEFGKTFRKINSLETDSALKIRNREYWNWSRLMRETVEFWGHPLWKSNVNIFYSGCSYLVLNAFVANFNSPTSTSAQISVATVFAKEDGIILELEKADSPRAGQLRYFNCSYLSCYASEDERLFCGGNFPLHFHSIRLMKYNHNYHHFVRALTIFNKTMNGSKSDVAKIHCSILKHLIPHQMAQNSHSKTGKSSFPEYIYALFKSFCNNKRNITIHTTNLYLQFDKITKYFVKYGNMVLLENIATLFVNCNEIHVRVDVEKKIDLTPRYMEHVLSTLTKVNRIRNNVLPSSCWNKIVFHDVQCNNKDRFGEFKPLFKKINWWCGIRSNVSWSVFHLVLKPWDEKVTEMSTKRPQRTKWVLKEANDVD
eukprot:741552_1